MTTSEEEIRSFINESLINYETSEQWSATFRGSALPICPRKLMLSQFQKTEGYRGEKITSFENQYHRHVGRSLHSLAQETWARQGLMWGDWLCRDVKDCGVRYNNVRLEGGKCIRCGKPCLYVEKRVTDTDSGFSGSCDAPVFFPAADGYLIFELKSRNSNIIKAADYPYPSDVYQVSMYATLLARTYWMRIIGRVVLWIGKPKPKPFKFWYYHGAGEELAEEQFKLKKDLDLKLREGRISEIEGICRDEGDMDGCPYAGICLSPVRDRIINTEYEEFIKRENNGKS